MGVKFGYAGGWNPFAHAGKGAQCIIKTQLALSHKQAEKASIVLIEEPESHLSFSRLSELMGVIEKAASGRQIIASTHSSFVANKLGLENLILLSGDNWLLDAIDQNGNF